MFNPQVILEKKVLHFGGFVNAHAHLDRAYTLTKSDMDKIVYEELENKWELIDDYKLITPSEGIESNITNALFRQKEMGTSGVISFIDVDYVVGFKAMWAAKRAKEFAKLIDIDFKVASQTLKGVMNKQCESMLHMSLDNGLVDIIGSLPSADKDEAAHLDVIFDLAKKYNKPVHVHVDQLNTRAERQTELLARKTIQHGWEGRVVAIHSISLAAHPKEYRQEVYRMSRDAGLSFVCCPTAWIDHRRTEELTPNHNAITPVEELIENDLLVAIGSDNIHDIYKPFSDGNMMTELRFLLEALHIYDYDELVKIATMNGRKLLHMA
jgi:cytosine/adenosine deaminase-related metal-dependent hydrolase